LYNIGKNIGAINTYLLLIEPINKFMKEQNSINTIISGILVNPISERNCPPLAAIIIPN
jgi:hypothetical protein